MNTLRQNTINLIFFNIVFGFLFVNLSHAAEPTVRGLYLVIFGDSSASESTDMTQSGIAFHTPPENVNVQGTLFAISKSFDIVHPSDPNKRLTYGSLEGPEYGVYYRGKLNGHIIELPYYWVDLVDNSTISVELTPFGSYQRLFVEKVEDNKVYVKSDNGGYPNCYYVVYAERKDIPKIIIEK